MRAIGKDASIVVQRDDVVLVTWRRVRDWTYTPGLEELIDNYQGELNDDVQGTNSHERFEFNTVPSDSQYLQILDIQRRKNDGDEEYRDQYDVATFRRRVLSVSDPSLRRRQVERHVLTVDAPTVVDHLQQVMRAAALGSADDAEIVLTFAEFIGRASGEESLALEALDLEARDSGRHAVAWMLLEPRPARSIDHRALTQMQRQA